MHLTRSGGWLDIDQKDPHLSRRRRLVFGTLLFFSLIAIAPFYMALAWLVMLAVKLLRRMLAGVPTQSVS